MEMTKMPDLDRRRFLGSAAVTVAAGQLGVLAFSRRLEAMTQPITEVPVQTSSVRSDIRPFHVSFPDEQLTDLRRRKSVSCSSGKLTWNGRMSLLTLLVCTGTSVIG